MENSSPPRPRLTRRPWGMGVTLAVMGLLIALGPQFLFRPCQPPGAMRCTRAAQAVIAPGLVSVVAGGLLLLTSPGPWRAILGIFATTAGGVTVLLVSLPHRLCMDERMACQTTLKPALQLLGAGAVVLGMVVLISSLRASRKEVREE